MSTLRVKPKARIAMKPATIEIGSVTPVITVERQELRNRKTIRTVSMPPISIVVFTSSIDSRMKVESSLMIERLTPAGCPTLASRRRAPSATATVFAPVV